jgi:hypothetical protein
MKTSLFAPIVLFYASISIAQPPPSKYLDPALSTLGLLEKDK